jgi:hypothetical protein
VTIEVMNIILDFTSIWMRCVQRQSMVIQIVVTRIEWKVVCWIYWLVSINFVPAYIVFLAKFEEALNFFSESLVFDFFRLFLLLPWASIRCHAFLVDKLSTAPSTDFIMIEIKTSKEDFLL